MTGHRSAVRYRARIDLRSRWSMLLLLGLLLGLVGGALIASAAAARRTESAFDRLRSATRASDIFMTGGCPSAQCERSAVEAQTAEIATIPGVTAAVPLKIYSGRFGTGDGRVLQEEAGGTNDLTLLASWDPRWGVELDRPVLVDGRRPAVAAPFEVMIDRELARSRDLAIGDVITITFDSGGSGDSGDSAARLEPDVRLDVVGVMLVPIGVRPPSGDPYVSAIVAGPGLIATLGDAVGDSGIAVQTTGDGRSTLITSGYGDRIVVDLDVQASSVDDGTDNDSLMLDLVALLGAIGSLLVLAPVVGRGASVAQADASALRTLGFTRGDLMARAALHGTALGLVAGSVALVCAVALSPLGPIGEARRFEPQPGIDLDVGVLALGTAAIVLLGLGVVVVTIWRASTALHVVRRRSSTLARMLGSRRIGPVGSLGLRMGFGSSNGANSGYFVAMGLGAAVVTAALTFTTGLAQLESSPRLVGMNYDLMQFAPDDTEDAEAWSTARAEALLAHDDIAVASAGTYFANASVRLGDDAIETYVVSFQPGPRALEPLVVSGRAPAAPHEILIHPALLDDVGRVGDTIPTRTKLQHFLGAEDNSAGTPSQFTIVGAGIVAIEGMFKTTAVVTSDGLRRLYGPDDAEAADAHMVQARFVDDIDVEDGLAALERDGLGGGFSIVRGEAASSETENRATVSASQDIVGLDLDGLRTMPQVLAVLLGFLAVCVLAIMMIEKTRSWRPRCAIHRALGITTWQVSGGVVVAAVATVASAVVVGVPFGWLAGRALWSRHSENLGALSESPVPEVAIAAIVAGALVLAVLVALRPARVAGRAAIAPSLRAE